VRLNAAEAAIIATPLASGLITDRLITDYFVERSTTPTKALSHEAF